MGKPKGERRLADNEAKAIARNLRISPQKLNLVASSIRGMKVEKALESAIANAENNHGLDVDSLIVAEAHVGKNLVMKRWQPRARGRVGRILKPFSQLTVVVREVEEQV